MQWTGRSGKHERTVEAPTEGEALRLLIAQGFIPHDSLTPTEPVEPPVVVMVGRGQQLLAVLGVMLVGAGSLGLMIEPAVGVILLCLGLLCLGHVR